MILIRHLRSVLAAVCPGPLGAVSVMFLVLAMVGVHSLCNVHRDVPSPEAGHSHDSSLVLVADVEAAEETPVEALREPLGIGSHGCADHHTAAAQCDPVLLAPVLHASMPEPDKQRLAPALAQQKQPTVSGRSTPAAPSLHALGISRT
ncbi:hypothetical protein [Myceligenerans crystallogenes]